jgi:transcriptional regulator with XRE-family HTH domain
MANKREFSKWLEQKFLAWQISQGSRKTITEFAEFLGFPKQTVTNWLNDRRLPSLENANEIAIRLGYDVNGHALLGLPAPNVKWLKVPQVWHLLTDEEQEKYVEQIERDAQAKGATQ